MAKFTERPKEVTAVKFTGLGSVNAICYEFFPYAIDYQKIGVKETLDVTMNEHGETLALHRCDYLVKDGDKIQIMSEHDFNQMYQPVINKAEYIGKDNAI